MVKNELFKGIAFILLGICIDRIIVYPIPQVREVLQSYFSSELWGMRVDIITIVLLGILTVAWFWFSCWKAKRDIPKDSKVDRQLQLLEAIAKKLGVTEDEIKSVNSKSK